LNKFWNEIDCISYSYVDQDTEEASWLL
jgi:hypothetical protein